MSAPKLNTSEHPLLNAGVHFKDENGCVESQATIAAIISTNSTMGDLALLQYYEWFVGEASTRRLVPLSELASSDRWVLYRNLEEMNDHYERVDQHKIERRVNR
jgi:hypothetical protein